MSVAEAEYLRAAWSKIDAPEKWCRGHYAVDDSGHWVDVDSPAAIAFCSVGAVMAVTEEHRQFIVLATLMPGLIGENCEARVLRANDAPTTTHADVRRWFAEAIARAEAEE